MKLESAEDAKLRQILSKQRYHQQQLHSQKPLSHISAKQGGDTSNNSEPGNTSQHSINRPVKAWTVHADTSVSLQGSVQSFERQGQHLNDLSIQDITSEDYEKRSTSSLLESESTYLPLENANRSPNIPARPMTAPAVSMLSSAPSNEQILDILSRGDIRPVTAIGDSKYDAYDKRPVKPLTSERYKSLFKPGFSVSQPQISGNEPVVGIKKKVPPTALAVDCDTSQDNSQIDDIPKENVENIPVKELSLIKDAAARKAKKTKSKYENATSAKVTEKRNDRHDYIHTHSGSKSSVPVASKMPVARTQSEHIPDVRLLQAAIKLQSYWRGYYTREHNVTAVRIRREIRARRAEEHIAVLRTELAKQKLLYEQEKQLRTLQLEAIRQLWKEVQSLQSWKSEVLQSQTFVSPVARQEHEFISYDSSLEIQNTLARAELLHRMGESVVPQMSRSVDTSRQLELEKTCAHLQLQVSQLQETLKSVSNLVVQSTSGSMQTSLHGSQPGTPQSMYSPNVSATNMNRGAVPNSLSPYPSEEEENYFRSVPQPGFPTPPRGLRLENRGPSALVLRWQASKVLDSEGKDMNRPLLGYRVFVNDKPKAMITGTKQKALIEGLDPSLTYKIYVKAVSELGESNTSDIVMAALSKGPRQRSSSSESNHSYDSEPESTSSERKIMNRKNTRRNRKTKSPKSHKSQRMEKDGSISYCGVEQLHTNPTTKQDLETESIMTQPKLHVHRRTRSKDKMTDENSKPQEIPHSRGQRSPHFTAQESQGFSFDAPNKKEHIEISQQSLSSTFTIDSQNSVLFALSTGGKSSDIECTNENVKGHGRRGKDLKGVRVDTHGDISDSSTSLVSNIMSKTVETGDNKHGECPVVCRNGVKDSPKEDSDTSSLHRSDSSTNKHNSAKISPTAGSQGVPVIDGRKRHGSGSRPSSPAHSDVSESRASVGTTGDRRRVPVADLLEQRFSGNQTAGTGSTTSSTFTLTQSQADYGTVDLPPQIPTRDKYTNIENFSTRSSHETKISPTERNSPTSSERRRTSSTCSENDISSESAVARQLDMDNKYSNNAAGMVRFLQKLQTTPKVQDESLRTKYKRKSGDSDSSDVTIGQGQVGSDSSGTHSDDSQPVTQPSYRTHRRTASDHRGVPVKMSDQSTVPQLPSHPPDHSPVIMDPTKVSSSNTSSAINVKRHASFHGILPSKKDDLVRSGSTENLSEKASPTVKSQNIDVTVPTTPTRRHRHRSRSRSPGGSASSHVPIISAAHLQRGGNKVSSSAGT